MKKRIKSFLITVSSLIGTALLVVVLSPEWASFVQFANEKLVSWGVPTVLVALLGVFISEVWKQVLNWRTISKSQNLDLASGENPLDLY